MLLNRVTLTGARLVLRMWLAEGTHLFKPTTSMIAEDCYIVAQIVTMRNGLFDLWIEHRGMSGAFELPRGHEVGVLIKQIDLTEAKTPTCAPITCLATYVCRNPLKPRQLKSDFATNVKVQAASEDLVFDLCGEHLGICPANCNSHRYACSNLASARPVGEGLDYQPDSSILATDWTVHSVTWVVSSLSHSVMRGTKNRMLTENWGQRFSPRGCTGKPSSTSSNKRICGSSKQSVNQFGTLKEILERLPEHLRCVMPVAGKGGTLFSSLCN